YNGAILNGNFAEFDEAARADQANAATVMRQYEDAASALAQPWDQPLPDAGSGGATPATDQPSAGGEGKVGAGAGGAVAPAPMPLSAWTAPDVKTSSDPKHLQRNAFSRGQTGVGGMGGMGAGYAPMAAYGRGDSREYESTRPAGTLEGGGEAGSSLSDSGPSWQPAAHQAEFTVSNVSWGPSSALFDELVTADEPEPEVFAEQPEPVVGQLSDAGVSPPVIGADGRARQ
ncbi:MAG TPA: hypothetical protein VIO95_16905, partial [Mycobacterium sp.]